MSWLVEVMWGSLLLVHGNSGWGGGEGGGLDEQGNCGL